MSAAIQGRTDNIKDTIKDDRKARWDNAAQNIAYPKKGTKGVYLGAGSCHGSGALDRP